MIAGLLTRLRDPTPLSRGEVSSVFDHLLGKRISEAERVAVLYALSVREETGAELANLAADLRRRARPFSVPVRDRAIDLCGSGGAPWPSFNMSTVAAFVVAAAGVPVAKHGNRSARGPCGSTDLLVALGLPVDRSIPFARASYREFRLAFLHAPLFHPAMAAVAPARRLLGVPTVFNRLGPLANPARVRSQVVGVPSIEVARRMADALRRLGVQRGFALSSDEGADEFSPQRPTRGVRWDARRSRMLAVRPADYLEPDERKGEWGPLDPPRAADETERILAGGGGARRGSVLLTSGAALWVSGRAGSFRAGVDRARETLDGGGPESLLAGLRDLAGQHPGPREG